MSKKRKKESQSPEVEKQADYYRLKTKAVDDLVNANKENSPPVSEEELRAYRSGPRLKMKDWLKVVLLKAWFGGAVCYFFLWGLGGVLPYLDLLFVTGFALGMVTDLLVNPILRFIEKTPGENDRWMMVPKKGVAGLLLDVLYGFLVFFLIVTLYSVINRIASALSGLSEPTVILGVEPVFFGIFYMLIDLALIRLKHTLRSVFQAAVKKTSDEVGKK